ncbi:MAG: Rrf2 family transcriptional regulator [Clostridium sp.]|nr:Rrf2 family transcriptional regulator [Clostridium sp.]MCM1546869.1 Rrf2 family transcriptional regulator [Ruminococcus sp.]
MLIDLSVHQKDSFVSLKDIAERQNISKKYLEQIVPMLSGSSLLRTTRGKRGGYMLARSPKEISVGDVLRAAEGTLAPVSCLEYTPNDCPRVDSCAALFVWEGLYKTVTDYLAGITLQDIIDRGVTGNESDYCI